MTPAQIAMINVYSSRHIEFILFFGKSLKDKFFKASNSGVLLLINKSILLKDAFKSSALTIV